MKRPKAYNHGRMRMEKPVLDAYALYFAKFVRAYAAHGISVAQVHVQNEPDSDQKFPSSGDGASRVSVTLDARSFNTLTWRP